jgi:hypothetical protein
MLRQGYRPNSLSHSNFGSWTSRLLNSSTFCPRPLFSYTFPVRSFSFESRGVESRRVEEQTMLHQGYRPNSLSHSNFGSWTSQLLNSSTPRLFVLVLCFHIHSRFVRSVLSGPLSCFAGSDKLSVCDASSPPAGFASHLAHSRPWAERVPQPARRLAARCCRQAVTSCTASIYKSSL